MKTSKILLIFQHLVFWLFNYWFTAIASDFNWNGFTVASGSFADAYIYSLFFNAVVFYAQIFWLFPKFYIDNKKVAFYVLTILVIIITTSIETYFDSILFDIYNVDNKLLSGDAVFTLLFHILYTIAGFYYILKVEYRKSEKIRQQLKEETYKTELKYLKAQLNPHFLFNGINSVYHLIGKNNELAKDTLLQFSGLLRYQLYESGTTISLEKELDYVSQYIKIEEIRKGLDIQLQYTIEFENADKKIAPLLLITFIENAFKHCSNNIDDTKNVIDISIVETGGKLILKSSNSFDDLVSNKPIGGIGLNNAKRRLSLLYPDSHTLNIESANNHFTVYLSINL